MEYKALDAREFKALDTSKEYSWLDVGAGIAGVLAKFPDKLRESAELDRQIREDRLSANDIYDDLHKMTVRAASDDGIRRSIAKRLNKNEEEFTTQEAQAYLASNFRAPRKGEPSASYANKMVGSWRQMFYDVGSDDGLDKNIMALVYGGAGEQDQRSAAQIQDAMKNRRRNEEAVKLDNTAKTVEEYEANANRLGIDKNKSETYKKLYNDKTSMEAFGYVEKYTDDIQSESGWAYLQKKLTEEGASPDALAKVQETYKFIQDDQYKKAQLRNAKTQEEADKIRIQIAQGNLELDRQRLAFTVKQADEAKGIEELKAVLDGKNYDYNTIKEILASKQKMFDDLNSRSSGKKDDGLRKQMNTLTAEIRYLEDGIRNAKHEVVQFGKSKYDVVSVEPGYLQRLGGTNKSLGIALSGITSYITGGKDLSGYKNLDQAIIGEGWRKVNPPAGTRSGSKNDVFIKDQSGRIVILNTKNAGFSEFNAPSNTTQNGSGSKSDLWSN